MKSSCSIRTYFHIYCPGCGGTRAFKELLQGHILKSLYYNPLVITILLFLLFLFIITLLEYQYPEKPRHYQLRKIAEISVLVILIGNVVVKDYLLIAKGIDLLGDFL